MLKHFPFRNLLPAMVVLAFAMTIAGCSTQKNTAKSRWWHAFNARYNTYYNGTEPISKARSKRKTEIRTITLK